MEVQALLAYAFLAVLAIGLALAILYPQLANAGARSPPPLELHVLRIADINGTVHITVLLKPRESVWLTRWCLGGHCYTLTLSTSSTTVIDLIDVDHAFKPDVKLVVCYQSLEAEQAPPARCISTRLR